MSFAGRLASQSSIIFASRLAGAGLTFIVQALIARAWGAAILADYMLAIAAVNLIACFMPLGFQTIGTYFVAEYAAKRETGKLVAFIKRAYAHVAICFGVVLVLALLGQGALHLPIVILACATAVNYISGAVLVGLKRPYAGYFADSLFRPMMVVATFLVCLTFIEQPTQGFATLLWAIAFGFLAIAALQFAYVLAILRKLPIALEPPQPETRRWWRFALPWVIIGLATDFFFDIDLLLLSTQLSKEDLAIFGVVSRIFVLVSFGVAAVYAVILPEIFEREANSDRAGFLRKVGEANLAASLAALVMLVGVIIFGPLALSIFGEGFGAGLWPLVLLSLALLVRSLLGPAAMVLSIYDHPWASVPAVLIGLSALVLGNLALVPAYGLVGAAVSACLAISLWSLVLWLIAWRVAKVDVSIRQYFAR
ncbi:oligosaccharide flippase family protein [Devosia sp. MC532]|uniref:oligosaccharide flippase family protein n=1 Tax=Devosia sp. MC532 TaxID=2799788 RepID=UPI0018F68587|nr:oligosaccharide flippase family protein [Devosia sp. MC532]MBJ7577078.1 oligosaccharide flippase family protein [Devosia sp. MC532]